MSSAATTEAVDRADGTPRRAPVAAALLALACACGVPAPEPHVRIASAEPVAPAPPDAAVAAVAFTGAIDPASLAGGARVALAREEDARAVAAAVDSDAGAVGPPAIPAVVTTSADGTRVAVAPVGPLVPEVGHALVVSSRLRDPAGRPVLDPDGRRRAFVHLFRTGPWPGPPPRPVLTEVRGVAATPEAGGEYVEVVNLGDGPLDLRSYRIAKRTSTGALASCAIEARAGGPVARGGYAIVAGGAYDGRYALPAGTAVYACGATALAGGIADDRAPEIHLLGPDGAAASTIGLGGAAPPCAVVERVHPEGPDAPEDLACADGSPGACNAVTPPEECPR